MAFRLMDEETRRLALKFIKKLNIFNVFSQSYYVDFSIPDCFLTIQNCYNDIHEY